MSAIHLHAALASLVELHGSTAVLEALRDACHAAADHTATIGDRPSPVSEHWQKAGDALWLAARDVASAEAAIGIDLADALTVLDDIASEEGVAA